MPAVDEHFISLNTYRAQSEQTIQDLGLTNPSFDNPGTEWRSWDTPALPQFNLWDRLLQSFKLDLEITNPRIEAQLNWYKRHPRYLERVFTRAERYMFHVVEEVEARNLPGELALLPIVESAYDPFAYSHGRASGMWQFIPSTARYFGIENDWWYDGRRDVLDSTDAALTYLDRLARRFDGDWMHALAAYNSGGGTVNRA
ncbi:transglycosylase SLT domain-containing protein, partial [Oceanospirillum sp. HFRX-1_2]